MRKLIIAACSLVFAVAASAQQALQCVNPDVLNSLVFNARQESKLVVKRTMPEVVAGFRAPAQFTLIGSGVRGQNLSTVVGYKTTAEGGKAFESLLAMLVAEGWKRESIPQLQPPGVVVAPSPWAATFCRNGERRNMLVQEISGVRYATIFGLPLTRACDAPPQQFQQPPNPIAVMNATRTEMPQFSFPENARMAPGSGRNDFMRGMSGVATAARIETPDSAASIASHLARQLASQGWRSDAEWKGTLSSGSTWTRKNREGQSLWGTLEILALEAGVLEVGFLVNSKP